jgi:hypothetical protein
VFNMNAMANLGGPGGGAAAGANEPSIRPSGRGSMTDPDIIQGRPYRADAVQAMGQQQQAEITDAARLALPSAAQMPRTILRFGAENELLISGMLAGGRELAGRSAIVDVPKGKGHIVMFANNPMWRFETQGSFFLLFNAMMNFDHLDVGRPAGRGGRGAAGSASGDGFDDQN